MFDVILVYVQLLGVISGDEGCTKTFVIFGCSYGAIAREATLDVASTMPAVQVELQT